MRAIIFSASVGSGHDQVAKSIAQDIEQRLPNSVVEIHDVIKTISPFLSKILLESYLGILRHMPEVWGMIHNQFDRDETKDPSLNLANRLLTIELKKCLSDFNPDIIICTHPFASNLMGGLRFSGDINCPAVTIITDYNIHSYWVHQGIDRYYLAHPLLCDYLASFGIPYSQIRHYGIPVRKQFNKVWEDAQNQADHEKFVGKYSTLLFMGGGLGLGDIFHVLENTDRVMQDAQLIVVCGHNDKLYYEIRNNSWKNAILPLQFVTNIAEVMNQADVIITKPGGITCTEALVLGKPIALISPIPGQEVRNQQFFLNLGVAITLPSGQFAGHVLRELLDNEERLATMHHLAIHSSNINAAEDIVTDITAFIGHNSLDTAIHK